MRRIVAGVLGLLLLTGLSGCDMTLMQEPTESYMETFGTKPPESDPGQMLQYRQAMDALRDMDYARALELFEGLGDFKDAAEYAARFSQTEDVLLNTVVTVSYPEGSGYLIRYSYDQQGRVVLEEHVNGPDVIESARTSYKESMEIRQDSTGMLVSTFGEGGRLTQTMETVGKGAEELIYTRNFIYGQGNLLVKDNGNEQQRRGSQYHSLLNWEGFYTYDDQGRLSRYDRRIIWGDSGSYQELYTYDEAGNLTRKDSISDMSTYWEGTVEEYTYDEDGNRLTLDRSVWWKGLKDAEAYLWDQTHIEYTWQDGRLVREVRVVGDVDKVTTIMEHQYGDYLSYRVPPVEGG